DCPSGFVTVTWSWPGVAALVSMVTCRCVASVTVTDLTMTALPNDTLMWLGKLAPGSKKPDPTTEVPVIVTVALEVFGTVAGETDAGVAGAAAGILVAWTAHVSTALADSWKVQSVMSSFGSTTVCE